MQSSKLFPSAKFIPLSQPQSTHTGKRNCTVWIIILIIVALILSCSSSILYYFKKYTLCAYNTNDSEYNESALTRTENSIRMPKLWTYDSYKTTTEDFCQESHQLQAVPENMIAQLNVNNNAYNYVNMALFLHVEVLIKKHDFQTLRNIFNDYNQKLTSVAKLEDFRVFLRNLNSNRIKFCLNFLKTGAELSDFGNYFTLVDELSVWYNYLHRLQEYLSTYKKQKQREFFVNITEVNFYKFTTETQGKIFRVVYPFNLTKKKILEINEVIQGWMSPVNVDVRNGSYIFSNRIVLLSEVIKKVAGQVHTVYILCGHTLYLDENVTLPGVNLGIVAPKWVFLKRIRINLNGVDGLEHEQNAKGSGKPGNPGSNAGDFLGVGDWDEDYLVVSANGGRGGAGQNGGKGPDGVDFTHPDPPFNKPRCWSRINAFQNSYKQTITRYKIFGEAGCGGSGNDGGVGGMGGKGGIIILINKSVKIIKGSSGEFGSPGKGGPGGAGGRDGCFYEVFDVNDEVLLRVTNVKCTPGNNLPSGKPGKGNWNKKGLMQPPTKSNLSVCDCIVNLIQSVDIDQNLEMISILKSVNLYDSSVECVLKKYHAYKKYNRLYLYEGFAKEVGSKFKYLNSALLARILILKSNINYFYVDYVGYLNIVEKSVETTNEQMRELQPVLHLKGKVACKAEKLTQNLKILKAKLINLDELEEFGEEKKMSCVMLAIMDAMLSLVNGASVEKIRKLDGFMRKCLAPDEYIIDANTDIILPQNEEFDVLKIRSEKVSWYLERLKDALGYLKESLRLVEEKKKLLEELVNEVGHFLALYSFMEWEESAELLFRSMGDSMNVTEGKENADLLKNELLDALIMLQYKLAEDAARQRQYPFIKQDTRSAANHKSLVEEVLDRIKVLRESSSLATNCKNELEAYFGTNSAVGEFYYWPNADIRSELESLFSGAEVRLESSLINRHVLDKNFIRFKSLKLEFESSDGKRGKLLRDILLDYRVAITHSGYSHYNWLGDTHVVVSEEMTFEYSFRTRENGEPELYNVLYKKVKNGEIILSPYTTWTVRLTPINERANYDDLKPYKDLVSLKLTGIGTFIP